MWKIFVVFVTFAIFAGNYATDDVAVIVPENALTMDITEAANVTVKPLVEAQVSKRNLTIVCPIAEDVKRAKKSPHETVCVEIKPMNTNERPYMLCKDENGASYEKPMDNYAGHSQGQSGYHPSSYSEGHQEGYYGGQPINGYSGVQPSGYAGGQPVGYSKGHERGQSNGYSGSQPVWYSNEQSSGYNGVQSTGYQEIHYGSEHGSQRGGYSGQHSDYIITQPGASSIDQSSGYSSYALPSTQYSSAQSSSYTQMQPYSYSSYSQPYSSEHSSSGHASSQPITYSSADQTPVGYFKPNYSIQPSVADSSYSTSYGQQQAPAGHTSYFSGAYAAPQSGYGEYFPPSQYNPKPTIRYTLTPTSVSGHVPASGAYDPMPQSYAPQPISQSYSHGSAYAPSAPATYQTDGHGCGGGSYIVSCSPSVVPIPCGASFTSPQQYHSPVYSMPTYYPVSNNQYLGAQHQQEQQLQAAPTVGATKKPIITQPTHTLDDEEKEENKDPKVAATQIPTSTTKTTKDSEKVAATAETDKQKLTELELAAQKQAETIRQMAKKVQELTANSNSQQQQRTAQNTQNSKPAFFNSDSKW